MSKLKNYKTSQCVKNLGVIIDSDLNFTPQIKNISIMCVNNEDDYFANFTFCQFIESKSHDKKGTQEDQYC